MTVAEDDRKENVELDEVLDSAQRILIRSQVGWFTNTGPRGNVVTVESRVAFSTAVNDLYREGYEMVSPEEYAENYGVSLESVYDRIHVEGTLFLLRYPEGYPPCEAVPLQERTVKEELGKHLA